MRTLLISLLLTASIAFGQGKITEKIEFPYDSPIYVVKVVEKKGFNQIHSQYTVSENLYRFLTVGMIWDPVWFKDNLTTKFWFKSIRFWE